MHSNIAVSYLPILLHEIAALAYFAVWDSIGSGTICRLMQAMYSSKASRLQLSCAEVFILSLSDGGDMSPAVLDEARTC